MITFSDTYITNLQSFVITLCDLKEIPLCNCLTVYSRRYQYKPSVKLFARSGKRKINLQNLFVRLAYLALYTSRI